MTILAAHLYLGRWLFFRSHITSWSVNCHTCCQSMVPCHSGESIGDIWWRRPGFQPGYPGSILRQSWLSFQCSREGENQTSSRALYTELGSFPSDNLCQAAVPTPTATPTPTTPILTTQSPPVSVGYGGTYLDIFYLDNTAPVDGDGSSVSPFNATNSAFVAITNAISTRNGSVFLYVLQGMKPLLNLRSLTFCWVNRNRPLQYKHWAEFDFFGCSKLGRQHFYTGSYHRWRSFCVLLLFAPFHCCILNCRTDTEYQRHHNTSEYRHNKLLAYALSLAS